MTIALTEAQKKQSAALKLGFARQIDIEDYLESYSGPIYKFDTIEEARMYVHGMRIAAKAQSKNNKFIFRIRARGPRQTPEVIRHYLELDWKHFVKTGQYEGDLESYMAMVSLKYGCRYAKARANQDLPTKFGKSFTVYRNYR